jgi:hypothetical protein
MFSVSEHQDIASRFSAARESTSHDRRRDGGRSERGSSGSPDLGNQSTDWVGSWCAKSQHGGKSIEAETDQVQRNSPTRGEMGKGFT